MSSDKTVRNPPATVVGLFRLGRRLGSGAFGAVFEAVHVTTELTYAIKRLPNDVDPVRFKKEALYPVRAATRSAHVLNVHSFFQEADGTFYLVTDLIRDGDLSAFIVSHGLLAVDTALDIAIGIAKGLAAIHEDGIVHLDLKPSNVLIDRKDGQWVPKIADFGLARSAMTQVHNDGLTAGYASPEHYDSRVPRSAASDMFSFGMVLFELLTGRRACGDATSFAEYYAAWIVPAAPAPAPSSLRPELEGRDDIDAIVAELLIFDAGRRTLTAQEAVARLTAARAGRRPSPEPVASRDVRASQAAQPAPAPIRRSSSRVLPLTAAGLGVLALVALTVWLLRDTTVDASKGLDLFRAGAYAEALPLLLDSARAGSADAQRSLGHMYRDGLGVTRDFRESRTWFEKAIDQDDDAARCLLADQLRKDPAAPADAGTRARALYTTASEHLPCGHTGLGALLIGGASAPGGFDRGLRHLEIAAAKGDRAAVEHLKTLDGDWPLATLVPGAWQPVTGEARREELARLASEGASPHARTDPRRLRRVSLEFYEQTTLFELETGAPAGGIGAVAYLRRPDGVVPVNGNAAQINRLNAAAPIRIDTVQQAAAYLRFYQAGAVQGPNGSFRVAADPSDLHWAPGVAPGVRAAALEKLRPWRLDRQALGGWLAEGTVVYNGVLFDAAFHIAPDGTIASKGTRQATSVLPLTIERFDAAGLRTSAAPSSAPPPAPGSSPGRLE
jgi:TPR repeat protein